MHTKKKQDFAVSICLHTDKIAIFLHLKGNIVENLLFQCHFWFTMKNYGFFLKETAARQPVVILNILDPKKLV